jgi:N-acetylglutamate synthase-like GNAT family acetyltransferase
MIRTATSADLPAVLAAVEEAGLPTGGLAPLTAAGHVLVAEHDGALAGCVAVEPAGHQALLRSLAVVPDHRDRGLGHQLVRAALDHAGDLDVWALTETASGFLARHGFTAVDRATVTGPVTGTGQWTGLCPTTATVLHHDRTGTTARGATS